MTTIRYEVVYKNLVRKVRKPFITDFKMYLNSRNADELLEHAIPILTDYAASRFNAELAVIPVALEELAVSLGCLAIPQVLVQCQLTLAQDARFRKVKNILYKFSIKRLEEMLADLTMMMIFCKYLSESGLDPSRRSSVTRLANYEAALMMVAHTCHLPVLIKVFDFRTVFSPIEEPTLLQSTTKIRTHSF